MNKILFVLLTSACIATGAFAQSTNPSSQTAKPMSQSATPMSHTAMMKMDMKKFDANGDGMISKDEYMAYQEWAWDNMRKNKDGMISLKGMQMRHKHMASYMDNERTGDPLSKP